MKTLQTYLIEAIKPPRLSAKNRELWKQPTEEEVMKWFKENCRTNGKVEIVDGKINVKGNVVVNNDVKEFPYFFGEVMGYFVCSYCKLTTLKNCPEEVGDYFNCSRCDNLTSLGAPKKVGGCFYCYKCTNLKSLEGSPKEVGGDFVCYDCGKEFTTDDVNEVCNVKGRIYV